jgi:hypothetical protein
VVHKQHNNTVFWVQWCNYIVEQTAWIHLCYTDSMCVFALSWFSAEMFFEATRSTVGYWLFFNRDLLPLLLLHLYKQFVFSYMEKLCCFCDIGSQVFYVFFQKWRNIFVTLLYELQQKSSLRTQEIAFPRSYISKFPGWGYPRTPPYKCEVLCMHQSAQQLNPPLMTTIL